MNPVCGFFRAAGAQAQAGPCWTQLGPTNPEQGTAEPTARIVSKNVRKSPESPKGRAGGGDPDCPAEPMENSVLEQGKSEEEGVRERSCGLTTAPISQPCSTGEGRGFGIEELKLFDGFSLCFLTIQLSFNWQKKLN